MRFIALVFLPLSIFASDILTLANIAYEKNPKLKLIQNQSNAKYFDIQNSTIEKNPTLGFGITDINLNEPLKRDLEPMQTHFITLSQTFTDGDKFEANKYLKLIENQIIKTKLNHEKELILKQLYKYYFEYEKLLLDKKLFQEKIKNIKDIQAFHNTHINHKQAYQTSIQNQLSLESLKLKLVEIEQKTELIFINISEIVNEKVDSISITSQLQFKETIKVKHPLLELGNLAIKEAEAKKILDESKTSSDYTLSAGYYQRKSRDDYINLGVKIPLQIYDREENLVKKSIIQIEEVKNNLSAIENKLYKSLQTNISNKKTNELFIKSLKKIITLQEKELALITNQNTMNTLLDSLSVKNKIIDNKLQINKHQYKLNLTKVELAYLSGFLRINHE
jgi:outer membrane protein TolC